MLARGSHRWVGVLILFGALAVLEATGCASPEPADTPAPQPLPRPTMEQVRNATINGVYDDPVTLKDGRYEGAPFVEGGASRPRVQLVDGLVAFGNLDGVPGDEAAVLLSENSGGSGEMIYLTVIGLGEGGPASLGTVEVGDRTKIRSFGISGADVVMEVVEAGPDDAMCCPTQLAHKTYAIDNGTLTLRKSEVTGTVSIALLAGQEWTAVEIDGEPLPDGTKPPTTTFDAETVAGFGGCNRYTGSIKETAPGTIAIGPLAGTRMACPEPQMGIEDRFLASLGTATQYSFLAGRLALFGTDGDRARSVVLRKP